MKNNKPVRPIPIPILEASNIAHGYGYDQVFIYGRRVGQDPDPHGEHFTTYGVNKEHCDAAARIGNVLKHKVMKWPVLEPIDMILHCPKCGMLHVDRPDEPGVCECGDEQDRHKYDFDGRFKYCESRHGSNNSECECSGYKLSTWNNPPHKSHFCRPADGGCGNTWRPADVPTNGVAEIKTKGENDTWPEAAR